MKRVIFILIFAGFLTACGGGGGGAAPSVNLDDSPPPEETRRLTPAEQAEVRTAANRLRSDLDSLENNAEADSLRQEIDALIADINAARHTIEELQNEIANLRSEINTLKVAETQTESPPPNCGANEEIIGGSCECISGYVQQNGVCELPPPNCDANEIADGQNCVCISGYVQQNGVCELPPPNCGANEMADGQNCVCISGYVQQNGVCELPPPNCGANEMADGQNCVCISGYVRQNGVCELPPPNCGTNEIADGQNCVCISGYVQQNGVCELPPPNCGANEMADGQNCVCVDGYQRNNSGMCEMIPPNCGANEMADGQNCVCISGYVRQNGVCELPPPTCGTNEIADGQNCVCVDGYQRNNAGMCEMIPPPCSDFRERNAQGECTYDTAEYRANYALAEMGALYAYESDVNDGYGAHGQGITIALIDGGNPRLDHRELTGQIVNHLHPDRTHSTDDSNASFHPTATGGLIVSKRDGTGMHGIAPESKLVSFWDGGVRVRLYQYILDNDFPIISRQHGSFCVLTGQFRGMRYGGGHCPSYLWHADSGFDNLVAEYLPLANTVNTDIVFVQVHGNDRWQGPNSTLYLKLCANQDVTESCGLSKDTPILTLGLSEVINELNDEEYGELRTLNISPYLGERASYLPMANSMFEDNFLAVVAIDRQSVIADFSNACGDTKMWCIAAHGTEIYTPHYSTTNGYTTSSTEGTSFSAPLVAGALALLKSAAPEIPMTVIRQILLTTTTDLGDEGIDEVYGWGAVNISAGIDHIENLEMANGMAYSDLRKSLPSEFSHLRGRMESVSVAIRITDRSFYNMRLSDIVGGDSDSQKTSLGNAAKEMQADDSLSPENAGFGFNYANGDYDLHYAGGGGNENTFRFSGGLRHDDSQSSYIGEGGGIFSAENASDTGGYVKWTTKNYGGISAFGEYGRTQIKADYDSASFISQIQNARAEEWTAGFQYRDLFLHNDNLQFSARQESRISGGEMILHYPVADGDSHKAFIGESPQTIRTETAKIPIKQKPQTIYTAGYSQKTENSKWSAAAEWNAATNAKGVSFAIELQIR